MFGRLNRIKNRTVNAVLGPRINREELRDTLVVCVIVTVAIGLTQKLVSKI